MKCSIYPSLKNVWISHIQNLLLSRGQWVKTTQICYPIITLLWGCLKMKFIQQNFDLINSLRPSDAIWRHRSGSTLAQVMACCLAAPSHYLNHCWLIISKVQWHSSEGNFVRDTSATIHLKLNWNLPWANELNPATATGIKAQTCSHLKHEAPEIDLRIWIIRRTLLHKTLKKYKQHMSETTPSTIWWYIETQDINTFSCHLRYQMDTHN